MRYHISGDNWKDWLTITVCRNNEAEVHEASDDDLPCSILFSTMCNEKHQTIRTVLEDCQYTLDCERFIASRFADVLIQASLHKLLLLFRQPFSLLGEVRDRKIQDERKEDSRSTLCRRR